MSSLSSSEDDDFDLSYPEQTLKQDFDEQDDSVSEDGHVASQDDPVASLVTSGTLYISWCIPS